MESILEIIKRPEDLLVELTKVDPIILISSPLILILSYFILPYLFSSLNQYPGPFFAKFTRLWLARQSRYGVRSISVHEQHLKHGKFVRIGPNEVSIADPAALQLVYAHGSGSTKSDFYDAFVSIHRGLFNTRSRSEHSRKRKIISNTFAQKSVLEFEPYIGESLRELLNKWDGLCKNAGSGGASGGKGDLKGYAVIDLLVWLNALAFDVIGDLAFGSPFGMIARDGADIVAITTESGDIIHSAAVQILNERGEFSATQGALPVWVRPYTKYYDPWFARGGKSVANLAGIARNKVNARLEAGPGDRKDILSHLQGAKDESGKPLGIPELTAEALTQMIAGSDTTSNSSCAILFFIIRHPRVHKKLIEELENALGSDYDGITAYEDVKALPYLNACISEALRRHSTSGMGLPRIMSQDTEVCGQVFKAGTILSVPSYTIHHLESVWTDPMNFRPERWLEGDENTKRDLEKCLNVFSVGPRSCVGRNLASMELLIFISTLVLRYEYKLEDELSNELQVDEGFLRKPRGCIVGLKRRK